MRVKIYIILLTILFVPAQVAAQSTEFTFQGKLNDGAVAANANYDFEFRLYDASGTQIGSTNSRNGVAVTAGIFSVNLDFGPGFPGADRFLEIAVRPSGGGGFTTLSPRQKISSSPYSIKSLTATSAETATTAASATSFTGNLGGDVTGTQSATTVARLQGRNLANTAPTSGQVLKYNAFTSQWEPGTDDGGSGGGGTITGVTASTGLTGGGTSGNVSLGIAPGGVGTNQIADGAATDAKITSVSGAKVTGTVANATNSSQLGGIPANQYAPASGSTSYIHNATSQQPGSNFSISGTGTANIFSASTEYRLGAARVLSASNDNLLVGLSTGQPTGTDNSFFGRLAGFTSTSGNRNSFFGRSAGNGVGAGSANSYFGAYAGQSSSGDSNSLFGAFAGQVLSAGNNNTFVGSVSGSSSGAASGNTFIGSTAGASNIDGDNNTAIGAHANVIGGNLSNATSIGFRAAVGANNSLVLGSIAGVNGATDSTNIGIGTATPTARLHVAGGTDAEPTTGGYIVAGLTSELNVVIDNNEIMARNANATATLAINADGGNVNLIQGGTGNVGIGTSAPADKLDVDGDIRVGTGSNGCVKDSDGTVLTGACSSDLRFKRSVTPFTSVLASFAKLRPVHFYWRADEFKDKHFGTRQSYGLIAQEVKTVFPDIVTTDDQGFGVVNYSKLPLLAIQAIKELHAQNDSQQAQIETQNKRGDQQQKQIKQQQLVIDDLKRLVCKKNRRAAVCKEVYK